MYVHYSLIEHHNKKTYGGGDIRPRFLTSILRVDGDRWSASCSILFNSEQIAADSYCIGD
jgi:hypothetical protein